MKTLIWSKSTRIFHWLLAVSFTVAYVTGENENIFNYHYAFGAFVATLMFFRIFYGLIGPRYSNFRDFPIGISHQIKFIRTFISQSYVGHNPAAALVMLTMMFVGVACGVSGYLLAAGDTNVLGIAANEELVEDVHKALAKVFIALVGLHLAGVFIDFMVHRKMGTLPSIFTGNKNVDTVPTHPNAFHAFYSLIWFTMPMLMFYLALGLPNKEGEGNEGDEHENKIEKVEKAEKDDDDDD